MYQDNISIMFTQKLGMRNILVLFIFLMFAASNVIAKNNQNESILINVFNHRYSNPKKGIELARIFVNDPSLRQQAYLSIAYNYYFLSHYDSAVYYLDKISTDDKLIFNMAETCRGLILQRQGEFFKSYQKLNSAKIYFDRQIGKTKNQNNPLFVQGLIENVYGLAAVEYYHLKDFKLVDDRLKKLDGLIKDRDLDVNFDLRFQLAFLRFQNYFNNKPLDETDPLVAISKSKELLLKCFTYTTDTSNYQLGNLFEALGFFFMRWEKPELLPDFIQASRENSIVKHELTKIYSSYDSPVLGLFEKALYFFSEHGDLYQVAGSYEHIAGFYINELESSVFLGDSIRHVYLVKASKNTDNAMYYHHARKPDFFKKLFDEMQQDINPQVLDSIINNLVSFVWYSETLKLKNKLDVILCSNNESDSILNQDKIKELLFVGILIKKLEEKQKEMTVGFYTQWIEMKQKQADNNTKNLILIFGLISLFLSAGVILYYFYRKKVRKHNAEKYQQAKNANENLEKWNNTYEELLRIKDKVFDDTPIPLLEAIEPLNKLIGVMFDAEYCAIGIADGKILTDSMPYFKKKLNQNQIDKIKNSTSIPIDNTIIGKFLADKKEYQSYDVQNNRSIINQYLEFYRPFMISDDINSIVLAGLYQKFQGKIEPMGYISFINIELENAKIKENVLKIANQIAGIIENEKNRRSSLNRQRDEQFITSLLSKKNSIDEIIKSCLKHLAKEFNAGIITFRVPVLNGADENNDETLLFILRDFFVSNEIPQYDKIREFYNSPEKIFLTIKSITFKESLRANFPEGVFWDIIGQEGSFYSRFHLEKIFTDRTNIIIPIKKSIKNQQNQNEINTYWNSIYGYFNIQPFSILDKIETERRLEYIATNISILINGIINRKKHDQINKLNEEIQKLDYSKISSFNAQIANLIKEVINAETCSLFLYNKLNNKLELKASTAEIVNYEGSPLLVNEIKPIEKVFFTEKDSNSFVVKALINKKTYMLYDIQRYDNISTKYIETIEGLQKKDYTRLIVPLQDTQGKSIGVIKCLGTKSKEDHLIHSFWDFDRATIEFITVLSSRFIENSQLDKEKDNFVKQMVHETLSPITEMLHVTEEFFNRMESEKRLPSPFINYKKKLINNILLQKYIILGLSDSTALYEGKLKLNLSKENLRSLILDVVRLLEDSAKEEKEIDIAINVSEKIPDMIIDRYKTQQVIINLLKNAINYSDEKTKISIFYKETNEKFERSSNLNWHEVKFVNHGIGIPEKEQEDIFLPYRRGTNASKKSPSGSGIGLYLVKKIVEAHGGICIFRKLNNPTEISFLLPIN
jgi:signal transduction histidine kinase